MIILAIRFASKDFSYCWKKTLHLTYFTLKTKKENNIIYRFDWRSIKLLILIVWLVGNLEYSRDACNFYF